MVQNHHLALAPWKSADQVRHLRLRLETWCRPGEDNRHRNLPVAAPAIPHDVSRDRQQEPELITGLGTVHVEEVTGPRLLDGIGRLLAVLQHTEDIAAHPGLCALVKLLEHVVALHVSSRRLFTVLDETAPAPVTPVPKIFANPSPIRAVYQPGPHGPRFRATMARQGSRLRDGKVFLDRIGAGREGS